MAWIYRLTSSERFPDPADEACALIDVAEREAGAYLRLVNGKRSPLAGRDVRRGETIYLATAGRGPDAVGLIVHGFARLGALHHDAIPLPAVEIYGEDRYFRGLVDLLPLRPGPVAARKLGLSEEAEAALLDGRALAASFAPAPDAPVPGDEIGPDSHLGRIFDGLTDEEIDEVMDLINDRGGRGSRR